MLTDKKTKALVEGLKQWVLDPNNRPELTKVPIRRGCYATMGCFCTGACQEIVGYRDATPEEKLRAKMPPKVIY